MPDFKCQVCEVPFAVPQGALDQYPGWQPKYCRAHSPNRKTGGGGKEPRPRKKEKKANREELLTRAQVLEKYHDGPQDGLFTDGSSIPNPGPGGWGLVWVEGGEIRAEANGHESDTTNNRMELTALIAAYGALPEGTETTVFTDSKLCVDTITKWAPTWERNGWKRKGAPLKNLDLIKELLKLVRAHPKCKLQWIAAHSGFRWNEYADCLATAWMRDEI